MAGNVRGYKTDPTKTGLVYREKGVDVSLAVDLVLRSCDRVIGRAVVVSSDSDILPAVRVARARGIAVFYLGFEHEPNKAYLKVCTRTFLISNDAVWRCYKPE